MPCQGSGCLLSACCVPLRLGPLPVVYSYICCQIYYDIQHLHYMNNSNMENWAVSAMCKMPCLLFPINLIILLG